MINNSLNTPTQEKILENLRVTERLLAEATNKVCPGTGWGSVYALPDLGIPLSLSRSKGGFFTGASYKWSCGTPFIPVDSTVNCCSVSVYRLKDAIPGAQWFFERIRETVAVTSEQTSFNWNLDVGNHFITYARLKEGEGLQKGYYAILHSSASEFKRSLNGLYPVKGNWYYDSIKTHLDNQSNRYLRYITGNAAERFFRIAQVLTGYNRIRHDYFVESLFGERNVVEEVLYVPHYGMPSQDSVAIGCNWLREDQHYLLLTNAETDLFLVQNKTKADQIHDKEYSYSPHGFGMRLKNEKELTSSSPNMFVSLGGRMVKGEERIDETLLRVNCEADLEGQVKKILDACPGVVRARFEPIYSYHKNNKPVYATRS